MAKDDTTLLLDVDGLIHVAAFSVSLGNINSEMWNASGYHSIERQSIRSFHRLPLRPATEDTMSTACYSRYGYHYMMVWFDLDPAFANMTKLLLRRSTGKLSVPR